MLCMTTTLRFATPRDDAALDRLAQLDSSVVPAAPILLAEEGGELIAAISARNGTVIADPFVPTSGTIDLLRRRARQLSGASGSARPRRSGYSFRPLPR